MDQDDHHRRHHRARVLTSARVDWRAHARRWEDRAKANAADVEDLRARLAAAESDIAEARAELARRRIADEHRIPLALVTGEDEEAMRRQAERVATYLVATAGPTTSTLGASLSR